MAFQRKNSRSLIRKIELFLVLFESLEASRLVYSHKAYLCFHELYLILYRSKILLDYCFQSSILWLLLQNVAISGQFNDLNREISTLLDVLPVEELKLTEDLRDQIRLLQKQLGRANLVVHKEDEVLRRRLYSFLNDFENAGPPDDVELRSFFIDDLGIRDARSFRAEIEFLEEEMFNQEEKIEPSTSVLNGFVALARYSRFLLFGFEEDDKIKEEIDSTFLTVPTDFCCPVTLDLMTDPVIISTGQTYDRSSIKRWMDEGHYTCPKTGQPLNHSRLVPNQALKNLIIQWCNAHGATLNMPDAANSSSSILASKAAFGANKATSALLIQQLGIGSDDSKAVAAREIRLMARASEENRAYMAETGAIPHLCRLLSSPNTAAQENSVTAILNLSIHRKNKSRIIDEEGCLQLIVNVLRSGFTAETRENAAATLFSLSTVHDHKTRIAREEGSIEALTALLREGTARGKKDAMATLFNLSTHSENISRIIESGAVTALVKALKDDEVSDQAVGTIALIVRRRAGAEAVLNNGSSVTGLIGVLRCGTPKGKENAVAALLELCRNGGSSASERVLRAPALAGLVRVVLLSGTKRARRKAASLARAFQRCEQGRLRYRDDSGYPREVTLSVSIPVPVV